MRLVSRNSSFNTGASAVLSGKKARGGIKDGYTIFFMILPSIVLFLCVSVYPFLWAVRYVFYKYDGITKPYFIGFDNFARAFSRDPLFWDSVIHTFEYAFWKLIFIIPLSLIVAVILNRKIFGKDFFRVVFFMPTVISSAVSSLIFYFMYNPYNGIINNILAYIGITDKKIDWLGDPNLAMASIVAVAVWSGFGNYMILFLAGLQSIPEELYESSTIDGANSIQDFWYITVPMLGPVMKIILLLAITVALKDYQSIMVLTNGAPLGRTEVMFLYVYKLMFGDENAAHARLQFGYGSTVGLISSAVIGIATLVYLYLSKKMDEIY